MKGKFVCKVFQESKFICNCRLHRGYRNAEDRSKVRVVAEAQSCNSDARLLVEWALVRQRSGRRCAVQVATASASVRCIQQGDVEPVGRLRTTSSTGDFQHVAMHRAAFVGADLMHDAVIAAAQALPTIPEIGAADSLQCIREYRVPHQFER